MLFLLSLLIHKAVATFTGEHNVHVIGPPMTWEQYPIACQALSLSPFAIPASGGVRGEAAKSRLDILNIPMAWAHFDVPSVSKKPATTIVGDEVDRSPTDSSAIWPHKDGSCIVLRAYDCYSQAYRCKETPESLKGNSNSSDTSFGRRLPIVYARKNMWNKSRDGQYPVMDGPLFIGDGQDKVFYGLCIDDGRVTAVEAEEASRTLSWEPLKIESRCKVKKVDYELCLIKPKLVKSLDPIKPEPKKSSKTEESLISLPNVPMNSDPVELSSGTKVESNHSSLEKESIDEVHEAGLLITIPRAPEVPPPASPHSTSSPFIPERFMSLTDKVAELINIDRNSRDFGKGRKSFKKRSSRSRKPFEIELSPVTRTPPPTGVFCFTINIGKVQSEGEGDMMKAEGETWCKPKEELTPPLQGSGMKRVPTMKTIGQLL